MERDVTRDGRALRAASRAEQVTGRAIDLDAEVDVAPRERGRVARDEVAPPVGAGDARGEPGLAQTSIPTTAAEGASARDGKGRGSGSATREDLEEQRRGRVGADERGRRASRRASPARRPRRRAWCSRRPTRRDGARRCPSSRRRPRAARPWGAPATSRRGSASRARRRRAERTRRPSAGGRPRRGSPPRARVRRARAWRRPRRVRAASRRRCRSRGPPRRRDRRPARVGTRAARDPRRTRRARRTSQAWPRAAPRGR